MIQPPPSIPWQITGNHWLCLPCIHPVDASIHLAGVVHAGARGAIEFAGHPGYLDRRGPPLIGLMLSIDVMPSGLVVTEWCGSVSSPGCQLFRGWSGTLLFEEPFSRRTDAMRIWPAL
jgi:hypothetical protein